MWASIGDARRALGSAATRAALMPLMASAVDEPSVFDVTVGDVTVAGVPVTSPDGAPEADR